MAQLTTLLGDHHDQFDHQPTQTDGMMAKFLHPRTMPAEKATVAIRSALSDLQRQYDLTDIEMLQAVTQWQAGLLRQALRTERHPEHEHEADTTCADPACPGWGEGAG